MKQEQQQIHFKKIKVIIFDLDRTLFDWDQVQVSARSRVDLLLEYYGVDSHEFWIHYDKNHDAIFELFLQQKLSVHEYRIQRYAKPLEKFQIFDRELAVQLNQCFIQHALNQAIFCQDAELLLNTCQQLDVAMVLLTNGPAHGQRQKIEYLKLKQWMKAFYISEERLVAKPSAQSFLNICADFDVVPEQCLMIGDDFQVDIRPALDLGMQAFWVEHRGLPLSDGQWLAAPFSELLRQLKKEIDH